MIRYASSLHDGCTFSTILLLRTIVNYERECALSCDTYLLFLLDVHILFSAVSFLFQHMMLNE
jgi:hypothetical protein